ncbi:hypothetical protein CSOJ01_05298 [Colletotrichum sojae]|uniref:Uncharacterized protein n=1 Tax=Colletotrichum sojae TaxID=2175907 RepID=A0A8H6JFI2_9PEZI|nr:hypothetical protein CSOJ01_05298 [Colletotrichum sojae]
MRPRYREHRRLEFLLILLTTHNLLFNRTYGISWSSERAIAKLRYRAGFTHFFSLGRPHQQSPITTE